MKTWKAIRTCHGFMGRYWREGDTIDLDDDVVPPRHFQFISEQKGKMVDKPKVIHDPMKPTDVINASTYSEMQKNSIFGRPKTGMAAGLADAQPKPMQTASEESAKAHRGRHKKKSDESAGD